MKSRKGGLFGLVGCIVRGANFTFKFLIPKKLTLGITPKPLDINSRCSVTPQWH